MDIKEILELHRKWRYNEGGGRRANLRDANLCDANLRDADLRGADLRGADLRDANLCDANLRDANLCDADLRGADLRDANLRDADLCGANLCDANLRDANLRDADLCGANLRDADLCGANLRDANLWNLVGNRNQIRSLFLCEEYSIVYTAQYLQIGCERHKIEDWWEFSDERILEMDDAKALEFWNENKEFIKSVIEQYPATKTGKEE